MFSLLDGITNQLSWWVPNRAARKWMTVATNEVGHGVSIDDLGKRVRLNPEFAAKIYDVLAVGATVIVTDEPAVCKAKRDFTILTN